MYTFCLKYSYGNPLGDPITQVDPGFRQGVIDLVWDKYGDDNESVRKTRDRNRLQPFNGYAYPQVELHLQPEYLLVQIHSVEMFLLI